MTSHDTSELLALVREEASAALWSKGVGLARTGAVVGEREHDDEVVLKVSVPGRAVSPTVSLYLDDQEWSCDCGGRADPCEHVAAAVIAFKRARDRGEGLPRARAGSARAPAQVGYRFRRGARGLELYRVLVRGAEISQLQRSLVGMAHEQDDEQKVAASRVDLTVELAMGQRVGGGPLTARALGEVLAALRDARDVQLDEQAVTVGEARDGWRAQVEDDGEGFRLRVERDPAAGEVFANGACVVDGVLAPLRQTPLSEREHAALARGRHFDPGQARVLVAEVLPTLREQLPVTIATRRLPRERVEKPRVALTLRRGDDDSLEVLPTLVYGDPALARVDGGRMTLLSRGGAVPLRDEEEERRLTARLERQHGLRMGRPQVGRGEEALAMATRLATNPPGKLEGREVLRGFRRAAELSPRVEVGAEGRFEVRFTSGEGGAEAAPQAVLAAWAAGSSLVPLASGGFAPLPHAWLEAHGQRVVDLLEARDGQGKVARVARLELAQLLDDLEQPPPPDLAALRRALVELRDLPPATLPADLTAELRDYQRQGVDWLAFMREVGLGALLADDMGLGKTVQAICALEAPALVVAPTSVLRSWQAELARFRGGLSVNVYHGPRRALDAADVTLTTYALLRLDAEALAAKRWRVVVLDEAQNIKNPESKVARAAFRLEADWRVALTGTPVQNRLEDLWSQLHFLAKGLLGGLQEFQQRFARPIELGNAGAAAELARRTKPFVLRREKREVATELPERSEVIVRCELGEVERQVYRAVQAATRGEVLERLAQGGNVLAAFEALLRLRQVACDASLVPGQEQTLGGRPSAKLALLGERLEASIEAGHKALVFSQWTSLLDRVEPLLEAQGVSYARLDGSTRDRQAVVQAFQRDDGPPVMLISLTAGGVGLTLTEADHVFLLDPWWNPAVEDQAADRVHRIGQRRAVLIHRLVADDTVEERLLELQEHKRALAQAALAGVAGEASRLTRDDLMALLA
jgi:superfamily II DNA or RNA helicase